MAFNSNVAPKRRVKQAPAAWVCGSCRRDNAPHWAKCPSCGSARA